jgi:hypothetical protein
MKFILVPIKKKNLSEFQKSATLQNILKQLLKHSAVWIPLFTTFLLSMPRIHCLWDSPFLPVRWTASIKYQSNSHCANGFPEGHPVDTITSAICQQMDKEKMNKHKLMEPSICTDFMGSVARCVQLSRLRGEVVQLSLTPQELAWLPGWFCRWQESTENKVASSGMLIILKFKKYHESISEHRGVRTYEYDSPISLRLLHIQKEPHTYFDHFVFSNRTKI